MHRTHQAESGNSAPSTARDAWLCAQICIFPRRARKERRALAAEFAPQRPQKAIRTPSPASLSLVTAIVSLLCLSLPLHAANPGDQTTEEPPAPQPPVTETPATPGASLLDTLPLFLFQGFYASNQGDVIAVFSAEAADIVLLRGGFDSGFRNGMICQVRDGDEDIAEILLVDVRHNCSAALITHLEWARTIEPGHVARIKAVR